MSKKALITGSSRGIGAAIAERLAEDGWDVIINYKRSKEKAESLAAKLGGKAVCADVSVPEAVKAMFRETGPVDLLVANAGIAHVGLLTDVDDTLWREILGVNTDGVYRCCREAIPGMVHNKQGCIIMTSSVWGVYGASCEAAYSASKAALIGLTKALAKELGPSGIRVNCVAPGVIATDMLAQFVGDDRQALADAAPLGRIGQPQDIAELVAFLASDKASFITGQTIGCDGGFGM